MLRRGEAHKIFLSGEILEQMPNRLRRKYKEGEPLILCRIKQGECPHKNQEKGIAVSYMDEDDIFSICKTKYLIENEYSFSIYN